MEDVIAGSRRTCSYPRLFLAGFLTIAAGAGFGISPEALGQNEGPDPATSLADAEALNEAPSAEERALTPLKGDYGSAVEQRWRAILEEEGLREGRNDGDLFIASGIAIVAMEKGLPGWIEARRIAFDIAFARAKAEMVRNIAQTVEVTGEMRFLENAAFGQGYMQEVEALGQAARILRKVGDFTEATLNTAISQLDPEYDPDRYSGMSIAERETVLEDFYQQEIVRAGSRMIGGAMTFEVIEGPTLNGHNHEMLVALIWTPKLSQLAATIDDGTVALPTGLAGKPVSDLLPTTVGEAVASFGTRVFVDEKGDRAILAFGQAEPATVGELDRDFARRAAVGRAEGQATAQIAAFVRENITFRDPIESQSLSRVYADLVRRGVRIESEQVQTIQSATGTVPLSGVEMVWRQVVQHPETGQDIAIVAALWSPSGNAAATGMKRAIEEAALPDASATGVADPPAEPERTEAAEKSKGMVFERPRTDRSAY